MKTKKIAILTTPLFYNYGGILQCYALLKVFKNNGYDATVIDIQYKNNTFIDILKSVSKATIKKYIFRKKGIVLYDTALSTKNKNIIRQHIIPFIEENIQPKTKPIYGVDKLKNNPELADFDVFVVGSDQVWRPKYCDVYSYFLGFVDEDKHIKKISYAASFGVDKWEFSEGQTQTAKELIKKFDAISVRENSAINICKYNLDAEAIHVLDPTMMLTKDDYVNLVKKPHESDKKLMVYILDVDQEKQKIIDVVSEKSGYDFFLVNNPNTEKEHKSAKDRVVPSIESWINGFMNAEFVLTDSFHGTVFSILFNIPFIVYGNKDRGLSRFYSLLEMFGLQERLIETKEQLTDKLIQQRIDWDKINKIIERQREYSLSFLKNNLDK